MNRKQSKPYAVYVVEGEGDASRWTRIGAAWMHDDNAGFNIQLNGRLVVRKPKAKEAGQ